jgi:hypothetical protein
LRGVRDGSEDVREALHEPRSIYHDAHLPRRGG